MLNAVDDLLRALPHLRDDARFTLDELNAYHEGYYRGLVIALQVLGDAVENYKNVTRARRANGKLKKGA
jgi:hypothetical protein